MNNSNEIIVNKIRTPDGTEIESTHRHDYVTHIDKNGLEYIVDGGTAYLRRNLNPSAPHTELSLYTDDPHTLIREHFTWGTYGKDGKQDFKRVLLKDMSNSHIQAILDTQFHIDNKTTNLFCTEVSYREQEGILIED